VIDTGRLDDVLNSTEWQDLLADVRK